MSESRIGVKFLKKSFENLSFAATANGGMRGVPLSCYAKIRNSEILLTEQILSFSPPSAQDVFLVRLVTLFMEDNKVSWNYLAAIVIFVNEESSRFPFNVFTAVLLIPNTSL